MNTGKKFDQDKSPMHLIPPDALMEVAKAMGYGEKKYGTYNYLGGMNHSRLYGAALRHVLASLLGEDSDAESGLDPLTHAACCILMLLAYRINGLGIDDRYGTALKKIRSDAARRIHPRQQQEPEASEHPQKT